MNVAGGHRISPFLLPSHPAVQVFKQGICLAWRQHPSASSQHLAHTSTSAREEETTCNKFKRRCFSQMLAQEPQVNGFSVVC